MTTPIQLGETLEIGIGSNTYTGYIVNEVETEPTAEEEVILDEDGDAGTIILTNPGKNKTLQVTGKDGNDPGEDLAIGDIITIDSDNYRVTGAPSTRRAGTALRARISVRKEDSMTYTA